MNASIFSDVATLYENATLVSITRHRIEYPTFGKFCVMLNSFNSKLDDLSSEPYWQRFLIPVKRLQFELCAATYPREYRFNLISFTLNDLRNHLRFCHKLYPDLEGQAFAILDLLTELINDSSDPLLDKLLELTDAEKKAAWLIKESRLIPHVEERIAGLKLSKTSIVHPLQLKDLTFYDRLIAIGPSRWFPESVFTAPRAKKIDILIFDWIKDRWKPHSAFVSPHKSSGPSSRNYVQIDERETSSHWDNIDPQSILINVDKAISAATSLKGAEHDEYENVEAICIALEGGWVVFVDANEESKSIIIDPDEDADDRIVRISAREIRLGTFILVRSSGGGDYIIPVADRIMGDKAQEAREYQRHWKGLLRKHVKRNGLLATSIALIDHGSELANEMNTHNWMSPRSIRTRNYNDFLAIMRLVGLEGVAQKYWNVMEQINRAHLKAGFEIRNLLLEQAKDLDMEALQKQGKMDFKLSNGDEGGITAFRVETVLPGTRQVPYSWIGQPFEMEQQLWRE